MGVGGMVSGLGLRLGGRLHPSTNVAHPVGVISSFHTERFATYTEEQDIFFIFFQLTARNCTARVGKARI